MRNEKKIPQTEDSTETKIKVYADRLSVGLRNQRILYATLSALIVILVVVNVYQSLEGNVIVIGANLVASGEGRKSLDSPDVIEARAHGHATLLYDRFFSFDYNNFKTQKNKAIYLGDKSIEYVYQMLVKANFYNNVVDNHYSVHSFLDTTDIVNSSSGVRVICKGRMELTNSVFIEKRKLDLSLKLSEVSFVKDKNPFGYSIIEMDLLSNNLLSRDELDTEKF